MVKSFNIQIFTIGRTSNESIQLKDSPLSPHWIEEFLYFSNRDRAFADLRYGEEDTISPSTLIFPATKG